VRSGRRRCSEGGTLLVGVEDWSGHVRGVSKPLDLEERLANLISDQVAPRLMPEIEILPWRRTHVLAVRVYPSPRLPDLDSEALDFRAASESFAPVRRIARRDLETLRLVTDHQGRKVPTVGGVLLFGRDRQRHFPDAWIQAGRFRGTDKSRILDRTEARSHPVQTIEKAIAFVQKHGLHGAEIGAVRRRERWTLPPVAVREAVINAVAHADYAQRGAPLRIAIFDDRLKVENPGLLPFGLTVEDLPRGASKLRNRVIGRVFHTLGLIEHGIVGDRGGEPSLGRLEEGRPLLPPPAVGRVTRPVKDGACGARAGAGAGGRVAHTPGLKRVRM
jgi:predicted HTH transcriptional regulator